MKREGLIYGGNRFPRKISSIYRGQANAARTDAPELEKDLSERESDVSNTYKRYRSINCIL